MTMLFRNFVGTIPQNSDAQVLVVIISRDGLLRYGHVRHTDISQASLLTNERPHGTDWSREKHTRLFHFLNKMVKSS